MLEPEVSVPEEPSLVQMTMYPFPPSALTLGRIWLFSV
jgi:hypothetical protein